LETEDPRPDLSSIDQIFIPECRVFILNKQYYGCTGTVKSVTEGGSVTVNIDVRSEIDMIAGKARFESQVKEKGIKWYPGWRIAQNVGITSYVLSRITGALFVFYQNGEKEQKRNIGLNLRSNKGKGSDVPGFTKRVESGEGRSEWHYSSDLQESIEKYIGEYSYMVDALHDILQQNEEKIQAEFFKKLNFFCGGIFRLKFEYLSCFFNTTFPQICL
jgi:5'-3' exoribonuclease 1